MHLDKAVCIMKTLGILAALICALVGIGCNTTYTTYENKSDASTDCTPGDRSNCTYTGKDGQPYDGRQECAADGKSFGDCGPLQLEQTDAGTDDAGDSGTVAAPWLQVSYPTDALADVTVYKGAPEVPSVKFALNAYGADETVNKIRFARIGGGSPDILKVAVFNDAGSSKPCDYDVITGIAICSTLAYAVPQNKDSYVKLLLDFAGTTGAKHAFQVPQASDIELASGDAVVGPFPMKGNTVTIGNDSWIQLSVNADSTPVATQVQTCKTATVLGYSVKVAEHDLEIKNQRLVIESTDGGSVIGSQGVAFFSNVRLTDSQQATVMGPISFTTGNIQTPSVGFTLTDSFTISATTQRSLNLVIDVACTTDPALVGHHFRARWEPMMSGDVNFSTGTALELDRIDPNTEIIGSTFQVVQ